MSQADILAVADVRRAVWTGGLKGLAAGLCLGTGFHLALLPAAKAMKVDLMKNPPKNIGVAEDLLRSCKPASVNHRILFALVTGAAMSYVGAVTAGTNNR